MPLLSRINAAALWMIWAIMSFTGMIQAYWQDLGALAALMGLYGLFAVLCAQRQLGPCRLIPLDIDALSTRNLITLSNIQTIGAVVFMDVQGGLRTTLITSCLYCWAVVTLIWICRSMRVAIQVSK